MKPWCEALPGPHTKTVLTSASTQNPCSFPLGDLISQPLTWMSVAPPREPQPLGLNTALCRGSGSWGVTWSVQFFLWQEGQPGSKVLVVARDGPEKCRGDGKARMNSTLCKSIKAAYRGCGGSPL